MSLAIVICIVIILLVVISMIIAFISNRKHQVYSDDGVVKWQDRKHTFMFLPLSFTVYRLDKERLFINRGIFTMTEDEVRLYRVLDLKFRQTILQKIFNVGDILLKTTDKSMSNFTIKNVCSAREVKELISKNVEIQRRENRVSGRELMSDSDDIDDINDSDNTEDDVFS